MLSSYLSSMYLSAYNHNEANICHALKQTGPHQSLLDIGCWDGINTLIWAKCANAQNIIGIEPVKSAALISAKKFKCLNISADKNKWPISDHTLDCIVSNQVVEHLNDLDFFYGQSSRVLKKGGYLITSTNNLSSWHNIFSLLLGWAPFDLSNSSSKSLGVGNPLAVHKGQSDQRGSSWTHKTIFTSRWLKEWGALYGFEHIIDLGAGLYPLPTFLGNIDKTHCAFITQVLRLK